ncbi:MAG: polysaccharide biosynthesis protein [Rhodoferax sp.]
MQRRLLALPRALKRLVVLALDMGLALLATWLAFSLRLDTLHWPAAAQWWAYGLTPLLFIPVFFWSGVYRAIFRYSDSAALLHTARAVALYALLLFCILQWMRWLDVPRTLAILQPLIFFLLLAASRGFGRFWLNGMAQAGPGAQQRVLIFGAGMAGVQAAAGMASGGPFELVGFVDDDGHKVGRSINGVTVYSAHKLPELVEQAQVTDILLALPSATQARRKAIIESLRASAVHIRSLPNLADLASGRVTVQDFREVDIEDLLGRDPVPPVADLLARKLTGKVVLVSGAGGSIGSELCRQIVRQRPLRLVLLEHSEFALYSVHQALLALCRAEALALELVPLLGSVTDARWLGEVCRRERPHTVYHAAAYKHVPLVEANPLQGTANNVFGTLQMALAAQACGAENFVLVSTDKAVRPTNVMGASKRLAELVLQALAARAGSAPATRFCMVRFGNVLGSSGSVVPLFRRQIASGGPLSVTHPEVTRYFMTLGEAAQLVLQAGAMAVGGEVFVLDMGEPVRIMDMARRMVELSGLQVREAQCPQGDIAIELIGLRPGEKLYEELLIGDNPVPTAHPRIMQAREDCIDWPTLQGHLDALRAALQAADADAAKAVLRACVQGYGATPTTPA